MEQRQVEGQEEEEGEEEEKRGRGAGGRRVTSRWRSRKGMTKYEERSRIGRRLHFHQ